MLPCVLMCFRCYPVYWCVSDVTLCTWGAALMQQDMEQPLVRGEFFVKFETQLNCKLIFFWGGGGGAVQGCSQITALHILYGWKNDWPIGIFFCVCIYIWCAQFKKNTSVISAMYCKISWKWIPCLIDPIAEPVTGCAAQHVTLKSASLTTTSGTLTPTTCFYETTCLTLQNSSPNYLPRKVSDLALECMPSEQLFEITKNDICCLTPL